MDEKTVLGYLARQSKSVLLDHLRTAFREMTPKQRRAVFGTTEPNRPGRKKAAPKPAKPAVAARELSRRVEAFRKESLAKKYYAPFNVNSKNWTQVPAETTAWCDRFAKLAKETCDLTARGEHAAAVRCFAALYDLLKAMESGDRDIIFGEEIGGWMIPFRESEWLPAYVKSLAATSTPGAFAAAVAPLLLHDSINSFSAGVSAAAARAATGEQRAALEAERLQRGIPEPGSPSAWRRG